MGRYTVVKHTSRNPEQNNHITTLARSLYIYVLISQLSNKYATGYL